MSDLRHWIRTNTGALRFTAYTLSVFFIIGGFASGEPLPFWIAGGLITIDLILWVTALIRHRREEWDLPPVPSVSSDQTSMSLRVPHGWQQLSDDGDEVPVVSLVAHEASAGIGSGVILMVNPDYDGHSVYLNHSVMWLDHILAEGERARVYIGLDGRTPFRLSELWRVQVGSQGQHSSVSAPTPTLNRQLSDLLNVSERFEVQVEGFERVYAKFDVTAYREIVV